MFLHYRHHVGMMGDLTLGGGGGEIHHLTEGLFDPKQDKVTGQRGIGIQMTSLFWGEGIQTVHYGAYVYCG